MICEENKSNTVPDLRNITYDKILRTEMPHNFHLVGCSEDMPTVISAHIQKTLDES